MDMIVLKTPIQITKQIRDGFDTTKTKLLFSSNRNWFIIIKDYKIEEKQVQHKSWSIFGGKTTTSTEFYLTEATILVWNNERKSWAVLTESGINLLLTFDDPIRMRTIYLESIKAPLENLGVKFKGHNIDE